MSSAPQHVLEGFPTKERKCETEKKRARRTQQRGGDIAWESCLVGLFGAKITADFSSPLTVVLLRTIVEAEASYQWQQQERLTSPKQTPHYEDITIFLQGFLKPDPFKRRQKNAPTLSTSDSCHCSCCCAQPSQQTKSGDVNPRWRAEVPSDLSRCPRGCRFPNCSATQGLRNCVCGSYEKSQNSKICLVSNARAIPSYPFGFAWIQTGAREGVVLLNHKITFSVSPTHPQTVTL